MTSRVISHFTGSPNTPIRIKSMLLTWMLSISFEKKIKYVKKKNNNKNINKEELLLAAADDFVMLHECGLSLEFIMKYNVLSFHD